jgi:hypothetical protein
MDLAAWLRRRKGREEHEQHEKEPVLAPLEALRERMEAKPPSYMALRAEYARRELTEDEREALIIGPVDGGCFPSVDAAHAAWSVHRDSFVPEYYRLMRDWSERVLLPGNALLKMPERPWGLRVFG